MRARWLGLLLGVWGWACPALAQRPPPVRARGFSPYEAHTIRRAMEARQEEVDEAPEGKEIEDIEVATLDVIEPTDPAPAWLNALHPTSRPYVIRREILLQPGDAYRQVLIDESARNLRALPQVSLVACIALRSSTPGKVRLLVVSKDVWSLRPGADVVFSNGGLEKMTLVPSEINVAGLHHTASLRYEGLPSSFSLGARYLVPRLAGSRFYGSLEWNLIFNRQSGDVEGQYGQLAAGRSLFSSITPWGFGISATFRKDITRRYVNASFSSFDAQATPQDDKIPFAYRTNTHAASATITRSFGWGIKHDLTLGAEADLQAYSLPGDLRGYDRRAVDEFRTLNVPKSDRRVGPTAQYRTYTSDFVTLLDYDTLGLQEDVRVGHDFVIKVYSSSQLAGASRNYVGVQSSVSYTVPLADGFARALVGTSNEYTGSEVSDGSFSASGTIATPRLGFGRIIFSASTTQRYRNYRNLTTFLGGDTSLRGYPSSFFVGKDVIVYNLEFRSRPVEIFSAQVGFALFHDVGDAYDGLSELRLRRGVGMGLRMLFPQLSRMVLRADLGVPLSLGSLSAQEGDAARVPPVSFFLSFGQAFKTGG